MASFPSPFNAPSSANSSLLHWVPWMPEFNWNEMEMGMLHPPKQNQLLGKMHLLICLIGE